MKSYINHYLNRNAQFGAYSLNFGHKTQRAHFLDLNNCILLQDESKNVGHLDSTLIRKNAHFKSLFMNLLQHSNHIVVTHLPVVRIFRENSTRLRRDQCFVCKKNK